MKPHHDRVDTVAIRHLDEIRETDPTAPRGSRLSALVMASFGGACIVFTALALMRSPAQQAPAPSDPLGDLVAKTHPAGSAAKPARLGTEDVTFPEVLSDRENPTTAMAAVRHAARAEARPSEAAPNAPAVEPEGALPLGPPPATDRLPVVPLPAQDVLHATPARVATADSLRQIADAVSREPSGELAPPGGPGGYQLQVSSFQTQKEADSFAEVLRRRGHRAYVQAAHVRDRGLWYRVRIGPFKYRRSAEIYRQDFEAKERMVTFMVEPPKTKVEIGLGTSGD